jgi:uncharacterized protein (TIGR01440 family)
MIDDIVLQTKNVVQQLLAAADLKKGDMLVVGCSSSEIGSYQIGSHSNGDTGKTVFKTIHDITEKEGIFLAAQCCEHLNRALVIEAEAAEKYDLEPVCVVPWLKGGGSFATAAYYGFKQPVVVEHVRAHAGIDIGDTLIGMHLRDVAVPVRIEQKNIGSAHIVCARTRGRLIGGERARYQRED